MATNLCHRFLLINFYGTRIIPRCFGTESLLFNPRTTQRWLPSLSSRHLSNGSFENNATKGKGTQGEQEKDQEAEGSGENDPYAPFPDDVNPLTGEKGGPRGPEPTRYGDWERKGRCIDF